MKRKIFHPFALIMEGFALGAILFFATGAPESDVSAQSAEAPTRAVVSI